MKYSVLPLKIGCIVYEEECNDFQPLENHFVKKMDAVKTYSLVKIRPGFYSKLKRKHLSYLTLFALNAKIQ